MDILEWMQIVLTYNEISEANAKHNDSIIRLTHELDYLSAALMQGQAWYIQSYYTELSATFHCALAICIMTSKETRQGQMAPMAYKSRSHTHSMLLSNESEVMNRQRAEEIKEGSRCVLDYLAPTITTRATYPTYSYLLLMGNALHHSTSMCF